MKLKQNGDIVEAVSGLSVGKGRQDKGKNSCIVYRLLLSQFPVSMQPESIYWHLGALCSLLTREHKEGWAGAGGWASGLPGNLRICIHRPPPSVRQSARA